jgi:hypothetical protein
MSVNEWDNAYARLARIASQLRSGSSSPGSDAQQQLTLHLQRLEQQLEALPVSAAEVQRRRPINQHFQCNWNGSGSGAFYHPSTTAAAASSPSSAPAPSQQQHQSQMAFAMRQQDDMIDELAIGVGRLRDQSQMVGDEARMHVQLLGDMEGNLDIAQGGLEAETRRAAQLKEDQSVWRLQLIVAGLSVLLVLLILLGLS